MPAFLHLFSTSWNRRWILTGHPVAQEKHVTALIPPPPPSLDSGSIRMSRDGPLEKLLGGGGEFSIRMILFSLLFSLYFFFFLRLCMNVFKGSLASMNFFYSIFPWYFAPFAYFSTSPPPPPPTSLPPWLFWWLMVPPLKRQDHTLEPLIVYYIECARN